MEGAKDGNEGQLKTLLYVTRMHYENCTHLVGQVLMHPPGVAWAPYVYAAQLHHVLNSLWSLPSGFCLVRPAPSIRL